MNEEINFELEQIKKYLKELDSYNIKNFDEFKKNTMKNLASSMCIFSILNSIIEIGERIISIKKFETPLKYREIFEILEENKIISEKVSSELKKYMYIRNMIAHQYGKINLERLYDIINKRYIFLDFSEEIKIFFRD